ncbi:MAG: B12-binding domain-containing radical SAM protein, partial [Candidatus Hydrogenedentota bacterium]
MKVVFVYKEAESLAIEYLSAVLREHGHETSLAYESFIFDSEYLSIRAIYERANRPAKVAGFIAMEKPDLVAFSVVSDYYQWACAVAEEVKTICEAPVVFGGIHVTAMPQRTIRKPFVDFAVIGEGEYALLDLVNALDSGGDTTNIPNVWCKSNGAIVQNPPRPPIQDLDSLPFPDKAVFTEKVPIYKEIYYVMTSRGCPYSCTYCCNSLLNKMYGSRNFLRKRTPENVIEELRVAKEKHAFKMVFFLDDDFLSDRKWLEGFLGLYRKHIGTIFRCIGSARHIDRDIATMLVSAGCKRIQIGVQTWNEELKRKVCRRYETNEQVIRACE